MPSKYGFGNTRKKSPAYKKSSGFKMKGSPYKFFGSATPGAVGMGVMGMGAMGVGTQRSGRPSRPSRGRGFWNR